MDYLQPIKHIFSIKKILKYLAILLIIFVQLVTTSFGQETSLADKEKLAVAEPLKTSIATTDSAENSDAKYPGGNKEFTKYLIRNLRMPQYIDKEINVKIIVTFTVDASGKITGLSASEAPKALQKEAIRVVKHSGRWIPALRNGLPVVSTQQQTISFYLSQR